MSILVIDAGSSSLRTLLFNNALAPIPDSLVTHTYQFSTDANGMAIADALELRRAIETCIDKTLEHPAADHIIGVGMAMFVSNLLGIDEHGTPITPIYTYTDTQNTEDVLMLRPKIDIAQLHQQTGCTHHTSYYPARFHWLHRTQPELFQKVTNWMDFSSYLYHYWFGEILCSYSIASWSGLLNRQSLTWDADWLATLNLDPATLPTLTDYKDCQTTLKPDYQKRWSKLKGVPFCLAVGDGAAANVGVGAVGDKRVALTLGTTGAFRRLTLQPPLNIPKGLWDYRLTADYHLLGGATSEGGNIFQWLRRTLALPENDAIEQELGERIPDKHGLTFLPLLPSERSPGWSVKATGGMVNFNTSTMAMDILQAAMEGVAIRLSLVGDLLNVHDSVILAGGGALTSSPAWAQMIANALDHPLTLIGEPEVTARGIAILVKHALGMGHLDDAPPPPQGEIIPNPAHAAIFATAKKRHLDLYTRLNDEII